MAERAGRTLAVLGLEPGMDPAVDVSVPLGPERHFTADGHGALLPGGIAVVASGTGCELAFVTTVPVHEIAGLAGAADLDVRCHPDPVTEASLVVHTTPAPAGSTQFAHALDRAQVLLARCAVNEFVADPDRFLHTNQRRAIGQPGRDRPPRS